VKYTIPYRPTRIWNGTLPNCSRGPEGRPSRKPVIWYKGFPYQAASWKTARRVSKAEFHFEELFPRVGFIVTNLSLPSGLQWIKEGKQAMHWTRLSCHFPRQ
jgi:hypothetical protein